MNHTGRGCVFVRLLHITNQESPRFLFHGFNERQTENMIAELPVLCTVWLCIPSVRLLLPFLFVCVDVYLRESAMTYRLTMISLSSFGTFLLSFHFVWWLTLPVSVITLYAAFCLTQDLCSSSFHGISLVRIDQLFRPFSLHKDRDVISAHISSPIPSPAGRLRPSCLPTTVISPGFWVWLTRASFEWRRVRVISICPGCTGCRMFLLSLLHLFFLIIMQSLQM